METKRLFISLELPQNIAKSISFVASELGKYCNSYSLSNAHYHITLAFLGDTDVKKIPDIINKINEFYSRKVIGKIVGYLTFDRNDGYVLSVCPIFCNEFCDLVESFKKALMQICPNIDSKNFKPHITISRKTIFNEGVTKENLPNINSQFVCSSIKLLQSSYPDSKAYITVFEKELKNE